jgi:hypothetical protein
MSKRLGRSRTRTTVRRTRLTEGMMVFFEVQIIVYLMTTFLLLPFNFGSKTQNTKLTPAFQTCISRLGHREVYQGSKTPN